MRYDASTISGKPSTDMWQLLDVHLLRNDLVASVWHLNSQPPLFNLYCGLVLKLPAAWRTPVEVACALVLGLAIVLATYLLLTELRVPRWAAMAVTVVFVVASPAFVLYENWLTYAEPTAAFSVVAALCLVRYLRYHHWAYGAGFFASASAVVLVNSTYQVEWLVVSAAAALVVAVPVLRRRWRQVVAVALVPLAAVAVWYVKDATLFGTATTSSWMGMNLARMVLYKAPPQEIAALQRDGTLTPLASIPSFGRVEDYVPRYAHRTHTGVAALDQTSKENGATNYNNPIYIPVSDQYFHDDLAYIRAHPGEYASDVDIAARTWLTPTDQNFTPSANWKVVQPYAAFYDQAVEWQPATDPATAFFSLFEHSAPPADWLSYLAIAELGLTLVGGPILVWRRRRRDPALAATLTYLWLTVAYAFVVTSLLEIGENERFRFELGPLPLVAAVVVVTAACRAAWSRWRPAAGQPVPIPAATSAAPATSAAAATTPAGTSTPVSGWPDPAPAPAAPVIVPAPADEIRPPSTAGEAGGPALSPPASR